MSVMDEIESNSDILRYISGGVEDDVTEDSFILVDRQTEFDGRSPKEQEEREKLKLEQMMTSLRLSVPGEGAVASGTTATNSDQQMLSVPDIETETSSCLDSTLNDEDAVKIGTLREENEKLKETLHSLNQQLRETIPEWKEKVESVQKENSACAEMIQMLQAENKELKSKVADMDKQLAELQNSSGLEWQSAEGQSERDTVDITSMKSDLDDYRKRSIELQELYQLELTQNKELKEKLRSSQTSVNDGQVSEIVKAKDLEIAGLQNSVVALEQALQQIKQETGYRFSEIVQRNEILDQELKDMEVLARQYAERNKNLSDEVQHLKQRDVVGSQNEILRLRQQIAVLDKENTELRTQLAAISTENESLEHWKEQCQVYRSDYDHIVSQKQQLSQANMELSQEVENLRGALEAKEKQLDDLHSSHTRLAQEHLNRGESDEDSESDERKDSLRSLVENGLEYMTTTVKSLIFPQQEDSDEGNGDVGRVATAPPAASEAPTTSVDISPCPLCNKSFPTVAELVVHCETCGENTPDNSRYGGELNQFVFVPHQ